MPSLLPFAAPFALLLPLLGQSSVVVPVGETGLLNAGEELTSSTPDNEHPPESEEQAASQTDINPLSAFYASQNVNQVRIQQRVTIRISPRRPSTRNELFADLPANGIPADFEEREMARCVPVSGIAAVQTGNGNRLILYLRDERIVTINLERSCRARDFYSGFYVERNADGQLCVDRDLLQSRSGAKCEIERMRQLVAVED